MLTKIVDGQIVEVSPEEEAVILQEWSDNEKIATDEAYKQQRALEYPTTDVKFNAIFEGFKAIRDDGTIPLPQSTLDWVSQIEETNEKYPKPAIAINKNKP